MNSIYRVILLTLFFGMKYVMSTVTKSHNLTTQVIQVDYDGDND